MSSTAGLDIMSSPDPLGDQITSSTSRVTRSMARSQTSTQRTHRQGSLLASSPRKQTFELDVGNERSPQRILVTVEAEDSASRKNHVNRRLFPPPRQQGTPRSPARREVRTTTTTVPLRGLTDDEGPQGTETPRRRGRPRKSGTPMPSARKRAGTPLESSPRRVRRSVSTTVDSASEMGDEMEDSQETPRPRPRKSPTKRSKTPAKKTATASRTDTQETGTAKRRGRPRRQALVPAEMKVMAEQDTLTESIPNVTAAENDGVGGEQGPNDTLLSTINVSTDASVTGDHVEEEEDMWLANMPESRPVPESESWRSKVGGADPPSTLDGSQEERSHLTSDAPVSIATGGEDDGDLMDFGAVDRSDTESLTTTESVAQTETDRDTIAQGEDFSMIMMDSIVSFRESQQYREQSLPEMGEATSFIVGRALESIRHGNPDGERTQLEVNQVTGERNEYTPNAANMPEEEVNSFAQVSTEPTPTTTTTTTTAANMPSTVMGSVPKTLWKSPRRGKIGTPLGRQLALKSLRQDESLNETPVLSLAAKVNAAPEESTLYDDSFSEIPEAVLEAATPRPPRKHVEDEGSVQEEEAHEVEGRSSDEAAQRDEVDDEEEAAGSSRNNSVESELATVEPGTHSDTGSMLLTPEETPSPTNDDACAEAAVDDPIVSDVAEESLHSSPPLLRLAMSTTGARTGRHVRHNSTETPFDPSLPEVPSVPPVATAAVDRLDLPPITARPPLSPIVRAGRALQTVTSDPPSPKGRESLLRSPFRSSTTRDSQEQQQPSSRQSVQAREHRSSEAPQSPPAASAPEPQFTQPAQRSWTQNLNPLKQIKHMVSQGAQMFSSPKFTMPEGMDDPFGPDPDMPKPAAGIQQPNSPFGVLEEEIIMEPENRAAIVENTSGEDGMDWEPSESPTEGVVRRARSASASSVFANRAAVQGAASDVESEVEGLVNVELEEQSPHDQAEAVEVEDTEDEEDEDIWAIEAQRPTGSPRKAAQAQDPTLNRWGRGKLPSPWTKGQNEPSFHETDDFSLLSVHGRDEPQMSQSGKHPQSFQVSGNAVPTRRVDLSTFFSSPALVPGMQLYATEEETAQEKSWPRKGGDAGEDHHPPSVRQKAFQPNTDQVRSDLFSSAPFRPSSQSQVRHNLFAPSSTASARQHHYAHVPQKRNFTPFLGKPIVNVTNSLFGSTTASVRPQSVSSAGSETTDEESYHEEEDTHEPSIVRDDEEADESSFIAPLLKPLPERTASPTKSCLRSPLKPKTPGPVVEFASSTLSPHAQQQARARMQLAAHIYVHDDGNAEMHPTDTLTTGDNGDKENITSTSHLTMLANKAIPKLTRPSSSLRQSFAAPPKTTSLLPPLSRTEWTKAHWIQMDLLLQERRQGSLDFQLQHRGVGLAQRRRSAALLGKLVSAQGESMALEQWHLDVVDAFRSELCGGDDTLFCAWDEHVLAKRLFALLVGEERRKQKKACGVHGINRVSAFTART